MRSSKEKDPGTKSSGKWKASGETKVLRTKRDHKEVIHHGDSKIEVKLKSKLQCSQSSGKFLCVTSVIHYESLAPFTTLNCRRS